jgi:glutamate synthase (NADPH/NADH) large chain
MEMVALEKLTDADEIESVWKMIQRHQTYTYSEGATKILADWQSYIPKFVKVMPQDYACVLKELKKAHEKGLSGDEAVNLPGNCQKTVRRWGA